MKLKRHSLVTPLALALLLLTLGGTFSLLRAGSGTCNGILLNLPFTDVTGNAFFCQIAAAYFSGLTNGTSATTYSPSENVTREQMAAFTTRTLDQSLQRGSRRAALGQLWTQRIFDPAALTDVGDNPVAVQSDGADLWVANKISDTVSRVSAKDGKVLETWAGMDNVSTVLVANGRIYAAGGQVGKLYVIDPDQPAGNATPLADLEAVPVSMAFDGQYIFIASLAGKVVRYDVVTGNKLVATVDPHGLSGIIYDGSACWVTVGDGKLKKLDTTAQVVQTVDVGVHPRQPIFDGANIWVPKSGSNSVTVVRAATGAVIATLTGNGLNEPIAAAFDGERILVANHADSLNGSVSLWRATDLKPLGSFLTGSAGNPSGACSDGLHFWITMRDTDKLARY